LLDAYHDRELRLLQRWRVRRHVGRCPPCRSELAGIGAVREFVRASVPAPGTEPDLWSGIAARLPRSAPAPAAARGRLPRLAPAGVALGAAALAALWLAPPGLLATREAVLSGVVQSINAYGRAVLVLEGPDDATIIWLMDEQGRERSEEVASVWI
jgi:anti-sigma factor RsiW